MDFSILVIILLKHFINKPYLATTSLMASKFYLQNNSIYSNKISLDLNISSNINKGKNTKLDIIIQK
jgi:hypothetical protein